MCFTNGKTNPESCGNNELFHITFDYLMKVEGGKHKQIGGMHPFEVTQRTNRVAVGVANLTEHQLA